MMQRKTLSLRALLALAAALALPAAALAQSGWGTVRLDNWGFFQRNANGTNQWQYRPRIFVPYATEGGWTLTQRADLPLLRAHGSTATTTTTANSMTGNMAAGTNPSGETMTDPGESSDSSETTPTTEMSTSEPTPGAPVFLSLQTNVSMFTAGESVIFTAVLTDPDGVDDIVGGTLSNDDGAIGYGPFVAAGQEGTYSITLSCGRGAPG